MTTPNTTTEAAASTLVSMNASKNRVATIAMSITGAVAIAVIVVGVMNHWDFLPLFWIGVVAVGSLGGLIARAFGAGFATAPCPACGHALQFQQPTAARTLQCEKCGAWSTGTTTMAPVPADHVDPAAVFETPTPEDGVAWPRHESGELACPLCAGPATRRVKITGSDAIGLTAAAVAPVSVRRVHSIEVPACAQHDDGAALVVYGKEARLAFRSYAYYRRFQAENPAAASSAA
ncbi:MAG: hypothetical protein KC635_16730 [Myxococcales bacterium]|nr:hypothetical protein [Myxococcales bacterium]